MTAGYLRCPNYRCGWIGVENETLSAPNPFDPGETLMACPLCHSINDLRTCCDEPECFDFDTCGTRTPTGYRRTCSKHRPRP